MEKDNNAQRNMELEEEYVNKKCVQIITECHEYIKKEDSGVYDEDTLSAMRETLIFKKAFAFAFTTFLNMLS